MGITNIHILTDPDPNTHSGRKLQEYIEAKRVVEHQAGKHPWHHKRRDCPLCISGK